MFANLNASQISMQRPIATVRSGSHPAEPHDPATSPLPQSRMQVCGKDKQHNAVMKWFRRQVGDASLVIFSMATVQIYDLEYFRNFEVSGNYQQHNVALKWFRLVTERTGEDHIVFSNTSPEAVAQIEHAAGTEYTFATTEVADGGVGIFEYTSAVPWRWHEMVVQLTEESMRMVVEGPNGTCRGLVGCRLQQTDRCDD